MATVQLMDTPGSSVYKTNAESCECIETGGNSFQIADTYAENRFDNGYKIQNNGAISIPTEFISIPIIIEIFLDIPGAPTIYDIFMMRTNQQSRIFIMLPR